MKYFSLFSGVGGFEQAIINFYKKHNKHPTCIGFSEIDKFAISVYTHHFPQHKNYEDITKINWKTVPNFDLLVGGSPCQDFSIAGKRAGIIGKRSGLIWEYIRCLREKKPTNFIWENVKGVMSSRNGFDFGSILIAFSEVGYDCEWQVLNANEFGIPQSRERIFIVGHLRGKSRPKVFPIRTNYTPIIGTTKTRRKWNFNNTSKGRKQSQIQLCAHSSFKIKGEVRATNRIKIGEANTLTTGQGCGGRSNMTFIKDGMKIRRLTPLECERLMSWPDNWTAYGVAGKISDAQRYKMCGNGVVSTVVEAVVSRLFSNTKVDIKINDQPNYCRVRFW